ncbi:MAG: ferritin [Bacillota bacterium]|jgi:ferritin
MLSTKIQALLNTQVTKEYYSSNLYRAMSAWFSAHDLDGFAKWYYMQAEEEYAHAKIIYNYILEAGGRAIIEAIDQPPAEWEDIQEILEETLTHEEYVTSLIYEIVAAAQEEKDFKTSQFFAWFVDEQREEEDTASTNLGRYKRLVKADERGLYLMDTELGSRTFSEPALLLTMEGRV